MLQAQAVDGAQPTLAELLDHGRDNLGVAVTLITGAEHANEVEIFFAINVLEMWLSYTKSWKRD